MNKKLGGTFTALVAVVWLVGSFFVYNMGIAENEVKANPDYICVKDVSRSCEITHCGDWQSDWTQTCYGEKTTQVAYYHLRTSCEAGYDRAWKIGSSGGQWGRHSSDFVYSTDSCSITKKDTVKPVGEESVDQ